MAEAGDEVCSPELEILGIADEIPAISGVACPAKAKGLVVDIPRLAALQCDNGIKLPAFEEFAPGLHLWKSIGNGESETVANVFFAAAMIHERPSTVHGKERNS